LFCFSDGSKGGPVYHGKTSSLTLLEVTLILFFSYTVKLMLTVHPREWRRNGNKLKWNFLIFDVLRKKSPHTKIKV